MARSRRACVTSNGPTVRTPSERAHPWVRFASIPEAESFIGRLAEDLRGFFRTARALRGGRLGPLGGLLPGAAELAEEPHDGLDLRGLARRVPVPELPLAEEVDRAQ